MFDKFNVDFVRANFPALKGDWAYFDNAGGTQIAEQSASKITDYLLNTNVQLGASYEISQLSTEKVALANVLWAEAINAKSPREIVLGSSTTALLQNLARALTNYFKPGDEIIVSNSDHEANIGPWLSLHEKGVKVKFWHINNENYRLELDTLNELMNENTKLVAFTHTSNILGTINPVKEIAEFVHSKNAMVCVDGVAYAPHRHIDVKGWDVDFYAFSLYKVYGPHYSLLYGKESILKELSGINHFFIGKEELPYKLQPGNVNFELAYGSTGILDYFNSVYNEHFSEKNTILNSRLEKVFQLIADHEEEIVRPLMDFLNSKSNIKIIGEKTSDKNLRVPTVSFIVKGRKSSEIPLLVDPHKIGIRWGDFYARRLIESLNISDIDGVVRISMVHYNTKSEVEKLIGVLDKII